MMKLNIKTFVINLSTLGIQLGYAVESSAGVKPASGYTEIEGIKSTPSLNPSPETIETTTLNEREYKTYVDGLKDLGGALEFNFNLTEDLVDAWGGLMADYKAGRASNLATWFVICVPGLSRAYYFTGNPSEMGLPETSVNECLEITNYITPTGAPETDDKPTDAWVNEDNDSE